MPPPTSMICPGCGYLINTDEKRCPHCGAYNPNLWGLGPALNRIFGGRIDVLTLIPTACIALYAVSLLLDLKAALSMGGGLFGMLSPSNIPLIVLGMTHGEAPWWTVLTATYLHGSLLHILFNVLWIRQLGPEVGQFFGPARYFIIYTVAGAIGFILSNLISGLPHRRRVWCDLWTFCRHHCVRPQPQNAHDVPHDAADVAMGHPAICHGLSHERRQQLGASGWFYRRLDRSANPRLKCRIPRRRITILIALICLLLTVLGFALSILEYFPLLLS